MRNEKKVEQDVMDRLPPFSFGVSMTDKKVVKLKRGVMGYYPTPALPPNTDPDSWALEMNKREGVDEWQAEAMMNGSIFGFHVPAADPAYLKAEAAKRKLEGR